MYRSVVKRCIDILFSLILLPLLILVILVIGLLIKKDDGGNVFYIAQRLGKNEKTFKMYKFRTMKMNAPDLRNSDGSTFNSNNDPRLTKIGAFLRKTSIDELPQILNVLMGNMSFIGPRPDLPEQIKYYKTNDKKRLAVLPGISGYNQAYYRNNVTWKHRIEHDIYYVNNISFQLDLRILLKTVQIIITQQGVYTKSSVNIDEGMNKNA